MADPWLTPVWPAPARVRAIVSTRGGPGFSQTPYEHFNLGLYSGEPREIVLSNRHRLQQVLSLPEPPVFLRQCHGVAVYRAERAAPKDEPEADAVVTETAGRPLAILSADCLPIVLCSADGQWIAAVHAGWRGLAAGIVEATVAQLGVPAAQLLAWLGPCIGQRSYEVGAEVREAFLKCDARAAAAFVMSRPGHAWCNLAMLARQRLHRAGVAAAYGGNFDTATDQRFYSYRRDGRRSGRFATLIWIAR